MHPTLCPSGSTPEAELPERSAFLVPSIESDLRPWVPPSPDVESQNQTVFAFFPCDDGKADASLGMPDVDAFMLRDTPARMSRASSCQEAAYDPETHLSLGDGLHTFCVGTAEFPMSDKDLVSFFERTDTADYHSAGSASPSPQVQSSDGADDDGNDVVFLYSRPAQRGLRGRRAQKQGSRKQDSRKRRSPKRITKSTRRRPSAEWKDVFLHLDEAGYHLDQGDEVFRWSRRERSWMYRGLYLTELDSFDLLDSRFYITVRPGGGFPIEISWDAEGDVFAGIDEINEKALRVNEDLVWKLMRNPHKSQHFKW